MAPFNGGEDNHVSNEDEAVAEHEAEVGRKPLDPEELVVSAEARHSRFESIEAAIEHLAEFEVHKQC